MRVHVRVRVRLRVRMRVRMRELSVLNCVLVVEVIKRKTQFR